MAKGVKRGRKAPPRVRRKPVAPPQRGGERYELAMRAINEGVYDWDVANGSMHYSEGVYTVLHMPRSMKTPADWRARIHPDDLPAYDAAILAHFKKKTERFECDYRYRARDRTWRWARQRGVALRDQGGRAVRMIGSIGDISELKRAEEARRQSDERYAFAMRAINEGVYDWNIADGTTYYSERVAASVGLSLKQLRTAADWHKRIHPEDRPRFDAALVAHFKGRTERFECDYRYRARDGSWRWARQHGIAMRDARGHAVRMIGSTGDINELKLAEIELRRARDEATEALERQTATAEILKVISNSPADVKPTFNAILESTTRVCETSIAALFLYDGEMLTCAAHHNTTPAFAEALEKMRTPPSRDTPTRLAALERRVVQVDDYLNDSRFSLLPGQVQERGRSLLSVPLLRDGSLVGVITTWRREVRPFTDKHVALLQTFADQAVIAIENVRLFNETREALEQQTATAEILRVISGSPTDTQPVFDAILERATKLCDAYTGILFRHEDGAFHALATRIPDPEFEAKFREPRRPAPGSNTGLGRLIREKRAVHIPDAADDTAYREGDPMRLETLKGGMRTWLGVPMLKDGELTGAIVIYRSEPRPFSDQQIYLLQTFADQAVIAIDNVRLFNETREALERQTATSEILRVISSSPNDLSPVFDAILDHATRLCEAQLGFAFMSDGQAFDPVAQRGLDSEKFAAWSAAFRPHRIPGPLSGLGKLLSTKGPVLIADVADDEAYRVRDPLRVLTVEAIGARTFLAVPLLKESSVIGAVVIYRREVRPFSDKQIALLQTFADQAVIAIENVRLFNETKEGLERQTATAEILDVISRSPTDLQPVFDTVAAKAVKLCDATDSLVTRFDGELIHVAAICNISPKHAAAIRDAFPAPPSRRGAASRAILNRAIVHIPDVREDPEFTPGGLAQAGNIRSIIAVPMLRGGSPLGAISVSRPQPNAFSEQQITLLKTFADQAVIAIENVRLFNETKEALAQQTATAEILRVIGGSMIDAQPVFDAIVKNCHTLFKGSGVVLRLVRDGRLDVQASIGEPPTSVPIDRTSAVGACVLEARTIHLPDLEVAAERFPRIRQLGLKYGYRSGIYAPLLRGGTAIGTIGVLRPEAGAFEDKEVALLNTFADQAVIAIENVRLFKELEARNRDVTDALEQQTATAEILRVISGSPTNVQPVFDAIASSALQLFGGLYVAVVLVRGEQIEIASILGPPGIVAKAKAAFPIPLDRESVTGCVIVDRAVQNIPNMEAPDLPEFARALSRGVGVRALLGAPMLREGAAIGAITLLRENAGEFSAKQVSLLKTFADQAVIAIENVRLFNETKEALERQTATAEILKVISGSPTDVQPVFDAIVRSGLKLFPDAAIGISLPDGDKVRAGALAETDPARAADWWKRFPYPLTREYIAATAILDRKLIDIPDAKLHTEGSMAAGVKNFLATGYRALTVMPMIRDDTAIGAISVLRLHPGPLSEKQIALLRTFADQAVIAIENVRLFNETRESLERQTATAEILKVIASSPSNVQPVFDAIARSALKLIGGRSAVVVRRVADELELVAHTATSESGDEALKKMFPMPLTGQGVVGKAVLSRTPAYVSDFETDSAYSPSFREMTRARGARSMLAVPMIREGEAIGAINVTRPEPGPFSEHQIGLLQTFADQAVIAIENVRLFKELQAQTEALTRSVGQLTALGEVGQAISSTLDLETVLKTIVSRAVQLAGLDGGAIYEYDERAEEFHLRATENVDEEYLALLRRTPIRKGEGAIGRTGLTGEPTQIPDVQAESYQSRLRDAFIRAGYRAVLVVPLLREEHIIGALSVTRKSPGPFAPEIVELLKTFATQSAMAIQNARLFREIEEKGKQLEVASRHKSDFLSSMSHELRTPLNAILGFNEMLLGQVYGEVPADMQAPLAQIQTSGRHLLRLINNVLDLAKIEAGRMELSLSDYSVHDTVESVRSTLRPLAAEKGLEFIATVPADIPLAYGDSGRITQCLMNLAGNSLKFTKAGKVEISVAQKDSVLVFRVSDTGIGIPPDKLETVFAEFRQTDATVASEYGGTGLGLSISRKFVEMHGGRIWAESEPGKGSAFIFEIPIRAKTT